MLRKKSDPDEEDPDEVEIKLCPRSLFVMEGKTQKVWKHGILKDKSAKGTRISFTFRKFSS